VSGGPQLVDKLLADGADGAGGAEDGDEAAGFGAATVAAIRSENAARLLRTIPVQNGEERP
jgi:hypothetical protein